MPSHPCVILNPHAGSAGEVEALKDALGRLEGATLKMTQEEGGACKLAREAREAGSNFIIAAGGDGTINEVVNGLAPHFSNVRFGVIPLGTGNDFARTIAIPTDLDAAVDALLAGRTEQIDVVRVTSDQTRYFINVAAGGFSGQVDEKLTEEMKRLWGPLAYLRSALEALPDLTAYHTWVRFDDEKHEMLATYNLVIANGRYVAGGIPIAPQANLADGSLDILLVSASSLSDLTVLAAQIVLGQHLDSDLVVVRKARKVEVDSRPGMWFNVDGELIGNEPATFEVLPRALEVVVGSEFEAASP